MKKESKKRRKISCRQRDRYDVNVKPHFCKGHCLGIGQPKRRLVLRESAASCNILSSVLCTWVLTSFVPVPWFDVGRESTTITTITWCARRICSAFFWLFLAAPKIFDGWYWWIGKNLDPEVQRRSCGEGGGRKEFFFFATPFFSLRRKGQAFDYIFNDQLYFHSISARRRYLVISFGVGRYTSTLVGEGCRSFFISTNVPTT